MSHILFLEARVFLLIVASKIYIVKSNTSRKNEHVASQQRSIDYLILSNIAPVLKIYLT